VTNDRIHRGFTLIEAAVVMAIIVVLGGMAVSSFARQRPRANLNAAASELQSTVHGARQQALATGHDVWVMVFPQFVNGNSTGRVIVYEDSNFNFIAGGILAAYVPSVLSHGGLSPEVTTLDLPTGVVFGPVTGQGSAATLPAPLAGVDVTKACSFCSTTGDGRGAIRFDPKGRASFYTGTVAQTVNGGASMSLNAPEIGKTWTLAITSAAGAVRLVGGG
jgi:prepilin-type N-terminal cleavage/methylation domain-containing protein